MRHQKLTKDALAKLQSQALYHFNRSKDAAERALLLELVQILEKMSNVLQEQDEEQEQEEEKYQGKSPFAKDPTTSTDVLLKKKGQISVLPPYAHVETVERLLLKEACR